MTGSGRLASHFRPPSLDAHPATNFEDMRGGLRGVRGESRTQKTSFHKQPGDDSRKVSEGTPCQTDTRTHTESQRQIS